MISCFPNEDVHAAESYPPVQLLNRIAIALEGIKTAQERMANHFDPAPPDLIGTAYIAKKLGISVSWVNGLIHTEQIPSSCIVPGTGKGKPWKFYRDRIEAWIKTR